MFQTSNVKIHQEWHHICFTLKTVDMNSDGMHVYTKMYLDGSEIDQGKIPTILFNYESNCDGVAHLSSIFRPYLMID